MTTTKKDSTVVRALGGIHDALITKRWTPRGRPPGPGRTNALLTVVLEGLITNGAHFEADDFTTIASLGAYSNTRFEPRSSSYYTLAVLWDNTSAAASWEKMRGIAPWRYPGEHLTPAVTLHDRGFVHGYERDHGYATARSTRVCERSALRIDGKWWRVYDVIDNDVLKLVHHEGDSGAGFKVPSGPGGKRWRVTRDEWAQVCARSKPETATPAVTEATENA